MSNKFREILNTEGITLVELSQETGLSISTIQRLCSGGVSLRPVTYGKATSGLNKLAKSGIAYTVHEVFPESNKPASSKRTKKLRYKK